MHFLIKAFILIVIFFNSAFAQIGSTAAIDWDQEVRQFENLIEDGGTSEHVIAQKRKRLRELRTLALEEAKQAKESLTVQENLLKNLGAVEEGETESKEIRAERKELEDMITLFETRIKTTTLFAARAQLLLDQHKKALAQNKRTGLFLKKAALYSSELWSNLEKTIVSEEVSSKLIKLIIIALLSIVAISTFFLIVRAKIQAYIEKQTIISIKHFSFPLLLQGLIATTLIAIGRWDNLLDDSAPNVTHLLLSVSAIWLAFVMLVRLHHSHFLENETVDDIAFETKNYAWFWNILLSLLKLFIVISIPLSLVGYGTLTSYILSNIFISTLSVGMVLFVRQSIMFLLQLRQNKNSDNAAPTFSPFTISLIETTLAIVNFVLILAIWGVKGQHVHEWFDRYKTGFTVGNVFIDPNTIVSVIGVFLSFYIGTRVIQWFLKERILNLISFHLGVRNAIIAIIGYVGITIGFFVALSAAGIDTSKFAIIAGALSVGIGFGLQAIVSNFISGLIILFERPIRIGDWVIIGDTQGFVKKIHVRSTELETFNHSSILVPNSQLITEKVINWTLNNSAGRIEIAIGVAYGSDTELVKKLLLQVAEEHPSIRKKPAPRVLFTNFGDSSLDFELRCFLKDIREKPQIASDLRFAIDRLFRENNVSIPFPQRDVHIKNPKALK